MLVRSTLESFVQETEAPVATRFRQVIDYLRGEADSSACSKVANLGKGALDCCGTGGSGIGKFNTSTASAFVIAAAGQPVVKFGNRSATSASGSIDFLERAGIKANADICSLDRIYYKTGLVFLNARQFYPKLSELAELRKKLGRPTVLNFAGPLLNPAKPSFRLTGVSNASYQKTIAKVMAQDPDLHAALVVRGGDCLDELVESKNTVFELFREHDEIKISRYHPVGAYHLPSASNHQTPSSHRLDFSPMANLERFHRIIQGDDTSSAAYRSLILNSAAGLVTANRVTDLTSGAQLAIELIASGKAKDKFFEVRDAYDELS